MDNPLAHYESVMDDYLENPYVEVGNGEGEKESSKKESRSEGEPQLAVLDKPVRRRGRPRKESSGMEGESSVARKSFLVTADTHEKLSLLQFAIKRKQHRMVSASDLISMLIDEGLSSFGSDVAELFKAMR